jgi:hypothetical protein
VDRRPANRREREQLLAMIAYRTCMSSGGFLVSLGSTYRKNKKPFKGQVASPSGQFREQINYTR